MTSLLIHKAIGELHQKWRIAFEKERLAFNFKICFITCSVGFDVIIYTCIFTVFIPQVGGGGRSGSMGG